MNGKELILRHSGICVKYFILFSLAGLVSLGACKQEKTANRAYDIMLEVLLRHDVPEISVDEAYKNVEDYVFVDSREFQEYEVSHIKNSMWAGYEDFNINRVKRIPKEKKIIVYCSVGLRSEKISGKLLANGYKQVSNMYGGIFEWANKNYPVYNARNKQTSKVHAYNWRWGIWLKNGERIY